MIQSFIKLFLVIGFCSSVALADDGPTPTPTAAPAEGGVWVKVPVTIESKHPIESCSSTNLTVRYPFVFTGAGSIKFVVAKAQYNNYSSLDILGADNSVVQTIDSQDRDSTESREYIVAGERATIRWKCDYLSSNYYGFSINEIYVSLH